MGDRGSCVSRAYYAARYTCLHLLEQEGLKVDRRWQHDTVINETISRARNKQWLRRIQIGDIGFANSLNLLHELRNDGDYGQGEIRQREAHRGLEFAQALFRAVRENTP